MSQPMPVENSCGTCGASLHDSVKFCRQCGTAVPSKDGVSVTEQTTRLLNQAQAPLFNSAPQSPVFRPANTAPTPLAAPTQMLQRPRRNPMPLIVFCIAAIFVMALGLGVGVKLLGHRTPRHTPIGTTPPAPPAAPGVPGVPAQTAPQPPAGGSDSEFVYPGATVNLHVNDTDGIKLQLHTTDSIDKVVAWYTAKLKPTKIINPGGVAVLKGDNGSAVITGNDDGTSVVFKGGK